MRDLLTGLFFLAMVMAPAFVAMDIFSEKKKF